MSWEGDLQGDDLWRSREALLAAEDDEKAVETSIGRDTSKVPPIRSIFAKSMITIFFCGIAGFLSGWLSSNYANSRLNLAGTVPQVPIGYIVDVFSSHPEFMSSPPRDGSSEPVWDSLLPKGLGYVHNPNVATTQNISTIGATHQLHCLYTLRRIYYATTTEGGDQDQKHQLAPFDNGVERTQHAAHCFEYLRQSIMCNADASLEPFKAADSGFPGMGFRRQCRDYEALKDYAEKWRVLEAEGFIYEQPHKDAK